MGGDEKGRWDEKGRCPSMPSCLWNKCFFSFDRGANAFACRGETLIINNAEVTQLLLLHRSKALMIDQENKEIKS